MRGTSNAEASAAINHGTIRVDGNSTALRPRGSIIAEDGTLTIEATGLGEFDIDSTSDDASAMLDVSDANSRIATEAFIVRFRELKLAAYRAGKSNPPGGTRRLWTAWRDTPAVRRFT